MTRKLLDIEDFKARKGSIPYRDEMNLAEFPLCSLSSRIPAGVKTLVFRSTITDQSTGKEVNRVLTITGSDKFGLPTPLDEEVLLGLKQLTAERMFPARKIFFTRYELIKKLGWRDNGQSYARIDQSLKKWLGVTLYYEKAWWSKEYKTWGSKNFHVIEDLTILDVEERRNHTVSQSKDANAGKSYFCWNQTIWESFQAGYIKQLDFEFYLTLKSSISKRIFRFLDKRFGVNPTYEVDLRDFAFERVALSRESHTGEIKRHLDKAISELVSRGFLAPLDQNERYTRIGKGEWRVKFISSKAFRVSPIDASAPKQITEFRSTGTNTALLDALVTRRISRKKAQDLVQRFSEGFIRERIDLHDYLLERGDGRMKKPPGFLLSSIEREFDIEKFPDFLASKHNMPSRVSENLATRKLQIREPELRGSEAREQKAEFDYWSSLSDEEQKEIEAKAVQFSEGFLRKQYEEGKEAKSSLFRAARQAIISQFLKKRLSFEHAA